MGVVYGKTKKYVTLIRISGEPTLSSVMQLQELCHLHF